MTRSPSRPSARAPARRRPRVRVPTTKSLLTRELDMGLGAAIELEAITQALMMQSDDFEEFYGAWSEGRRPEWKGR